MNSNILRLDLNPLFEQVENITSKYMNRTYPSGLYSSIHRFPLHFSGILTYVKTKEQENREIVNTNRPLKLLDIQDSTDALIATAKQIENGFVGIKPSMHVLPATVLGYYIDIYQRDLSSKKSMFYKDDLNIDTTQLISVSLTDTTISILESYYPDIPIEALYEIDAVYRNTIDHEIKNFISNDTQALYVTNSDGIHTIIIREDIFKIRYRFMCRTGKTGPDKYTTALLEQTTAPMPAKKFNLTEEFIPSVLNGYDSILFFKDSPYMLRFNGRTFSLMFIPSRSISDEDSEVKLKIVHKIFNYVNNVMIKNTGVRYELTGVTILE